MAGSYEQPERTVEFYKALAQRDLELIESQRDEIAKLKKKVNQLQQKLGKHSNTKGE